MFIKHYIKKWINSPHSSSRVKILRLLIHIYNNASLKNKLLLKQDNSLNYGMSLIKNTKIIVNGKSNNIIIGDMCHLKNCHIYINGNSNTVNIGNHCNFNQTMLCIEDDNNEIRIGNGTTIHGNTHLAAIESTKLIIGSDCMFSSDITFRTGDSHSIIDTNGRRLNYSKDIVISDHVWVGTKVICLKGVSVPKNCVIGANSLLTRKFSEENCIIAGNPANIIKNKTNWKRER